LYFIIDSKFLKFEQKKMVKNTFKNQT